MSAIDKQSESFIADMRADRAEFCAEMRAGFAEVRDDLVALRRTLDLIFAVFAVGILGVAAAAQF